MEFLKNEIAKKRKELEEANLLVSAQILLIEIYEIKII